KRRFRPGRIFARASSSASTGGRSCWPASRMTSPRRASPPRWRDADFPPTGSGRPRPARLSTGKAGRSGQAAEWPQIEIQLPGVESEAARELGDRLLQLHQSQAERLDLRGAERAGIHPSQRLTLEELPQKLGQRQHQLADRPLHILRIRIPPPRAAGRRQPGELRPERRQLLRAERADAAVVQAPGSGTNAYGVQGPLETTWRSASWHVTLLRAC